MAAASQTLFDHLVGGSCQTRQYSPSQGREGNGSYLTFPIADASSKHATIS